MRGGRSWSNVRREIFRTVLTVKKDFDKLPKNTTPDIGYLRKPNLYFGYHCAKWQKIYEYANLYVVYRQLHSGPQCMKWVKFYVVYRQMHSGPWCTNYLKSLRKVLVNHQSTPRNRKLCKIICGIPPNALRSLMYEMANIFCENLSEPLINTRKI